MSHRSHLVCTVRRADSDVYKFQRELKKIKYPVLAIEPADQLRIKITQFKNQKLASQMKVKLIQQKQLNSYRKIRGDGNCFFRALAYSYLSNVKILESVQNTFFQLDDIKLDLCYEQSIPKQFRPYYNDKILKDVLRNNWPIDVKYFALSCRSNNKRILSRLFRKYPYLDFIVILYFRSLCFHGFKKCRQQLKQFMKGTQQQQILTYGQQSEGVILDICSRSIKVNIDVYEVRKQQLKHYSYKNINNLKNIIQVSLLFYENHYDILEKIDQAKLSQEKQDLMIKEEDYYSEVQEKIVQGQCIECGQEGSVFDQSFLCFKCFQISKNQMLSTFQKDKYIVGTCISCEMSHKKVLQSVKMCESCIKSQSFIKTSPNKKAVYYCRFCQGQLTNNQKCRKCLDGYEIASCIQCGIKRPLQVQTKLCDQCREIQAKYLHRKQQKIKTCQNCTESFTSQYHKTRCQNNLALSKIVLQTPKIQDLPNRPARIFDKFSQKQQKSKLYKGKICYKCDKQLKMDQNLIDKLCQKCYTVVCTKNKQTNNNDSGKSMIYGQKMKQEDQKCQKCKRKVYTYKVENGLCIACRKQTSRIF